MTNDARDQILRNRDLMTSRELTDVRAINRLFHFEFVSLVKCYIHADSLVTFYLMRSYSGIFVKL